jgi:hypothetical protein
MGENFSGSYTVTRRNPLIHIGATTATKPGCFYPKAVQQGLLSRGWLCVEEWLATANFGEYYSFPRTPVDNERLGSDIQTLKTPQLMFRALLTKDGAQRLELART